jgi:hypothetical protein
MLTLFDVNCTLGSWMTGGPALANAAEVLAEMDRLGVAKALVRHTCGGYYHAPEGNAFLMEQLTGQGRLVPCWAGLPPVTGELGALQDWLSDLSAHDVRAVCLYPASNGYPLTVWQCDALLGPLAERSYLLLLELAETNWEALHTICGAYPRLKVVLLSTGYRVLRPLYALLEAHPNLYVDTSILSNFMVLEEMAARFGADRLLFGTGAPRYEGAGSITALRYAALSEIERQAIAGGNLERLLGEVQR